MKVATKLTLLLVSVAVQSSFASLILVTSRGSLSGSDSLAISSIAPDGTVMMSGFMAMTTAHNVVSVSDIGGNGMSILQEGNEWSGNFAPNDALLWTGNIITGNPDSGPVTLAFATAVGGVGMQIQPDQIPSKFMASITAFDSGNNNLGSFTEMGMSTAANDGSAIFLGVQSSSSNISRILINITMPSGIDFAFNRLTFGAPIMVTAPEPTSLALLLCGALLFPAIVSKRRRL
jgi:hypothetical protein